MKTVQEMQAEGMTPEDIEKALREQNLDAGDLEKALCELEELNKSEGADVDNIDDLLKALDAQEEDLAKSADNDADDEGGEGEDEEVEEEDEGMGKSLDTEMDELIKASEAFGDLEKAVHEGNGALLSRLATLEKAQLHSMNLLIKMAKAIAGMEEGMLKSFSDLGGLPAAHHPGYLGQGREVKTDGGLHKSKNDISRALTKAVQEKRVAAGNLGVFATHFDSKGIDCLPEDVQKEIGL